jgi:hypothetical protein
MPAIVKHHFMYYNIKYAKNIDLAGLLFSWSGY